MTPLKLVSTIKDYIWGGHKLRDEFGKNSNTERIAESWELSCHKNGMSIINSGEYDGKTLAEYIEKNPDVLGTNCLDFDFFPVLIKLIDAKDNLSIQVHPDNKYALVHEGEYGKIEMWYIVDCDPDAEIIYGVKYKMSPEYFRKAIEDNKILDIVNRVKVKKRDVFLINPGTIHAIGKGIVITEVQQNSNTTYRIYDYDRVDINNTPRELHIEKALEVISLRPATISKNHTEFSLKGEFDGTKVRVLAECKYFTTSLAELSYSKFRIEVDKTSFWHILVIDGSGKILVSGSTTVYPLYKGASYFIPADAGKFIIITEKKCSIINTTVNKIVEC